VFGVGIIRFLGYFSGVIRVLRWCIIGFCRFSGIFGDFRGIFGVFREACGVCCICSILSFWVFG